MMANLNLKELWYISIVKMSKWIFIRENKAKLILSFTIETYRYNLHFQLRCNLELLVPDF